MSYWLDDTVTAWGDHKLKSGSAANHIPGIGSSSCWIQLGLRTAT